MTSTVIRYETQSLMRHFKRSDRLAGQILRDISQLLQTEMSQVADGLVTFTRVSLTDDLRYAKVYYSYLGSDEGKEQVAAYLEQENKRIRQQVGRNLRVRHIPELTFVFDPSIEGGIRIEKLLNDIRRERDQD